MSINVGRNRGPGYRPPVDVASKPQLHPPKAADPARVRAASDVSTFEPARAVQQQPKTAPKPQPAPAAEPQKKGFFARLGDAVGSFFAGVGGAAKGVVQNLGEAAGTFFGGLGKLFTGHFGEGFKQMGAGLVKVVQTPIDAILMIGGKVLSGVQTLLGVEPVGRKLTGAEIAELRKVYGDSIDYSAIQIKEGKSGLLTSFGRAFVMGNTIYMPESPFDLSTLVHETGHVWQYQHGGTDYMSEALYAQFFGDAYLWEKGISEGKSWSQLDPEQQATLIQNAYESGYFDSPNARFIWNGTDYTDYMRAAFAELRAGRGAP